MRPSSNARRPEGSSNSSSSSNPPHPSPRRQPRCQSERKRRHRLRSSPRAAQRRLRSRRCSPRLRLRRARRSPRRPVSLLQLQHLRAMWARQRSLSRRQSNHRLSAVNNCAVSVSLLPAVHSHALWCCRLPEGAVESPALQVPERAVHARGAFGTRTGATPCRYSHRGACCLMAHEKQVLFSLSHSLREGNTDPSAGAV